MSNEAAGDRPRVPTLHKMGDLLQLFTPDRPVWRMTELAREMGWTEPTTHRFANAMVEIGMLAQTPDGGFTVGLLPVRLGAVYMGVEPHRQALIDRLDEIVEETGLTTQIGVLDGGTVSIIASREGRSALNAAANLGERLPLHATALGKVILAQVDAGALLPGRLESFTERTHTVREEVLAEVAEVERTGLARGDSELAQGLYAVAVPLPAAYFDDRPAGLACAGPGPELVPDECKRAETVLAGLCAALQTEAAPLRRAQGAA